MKNPSFIIAAKRSPIGKILGSLKSFSSVDLAVYVIVSMLNESLFTAEEIDEVIIGNVLSAGQGQGIARKISISAGIPKEVCAYRIDMVCGSGMKAVINAAMQIQSQEADLILAGGTESMSNAPFLISGKVRSGNKMGDLLLRDSMLCDSLVDSFSQQHMGLTAEMIADTHHISKQEQDIFSYCSQKKAISAINSGQFIDEIVPIILDKKNNIVMHQDEYPRLECTLEKLSNLKSAFKPKGTVSAGNSSGLNDGAAILAIASENYINNHTVKPLAEILAFAHAGVDPEQMGLAPIQAVINLMKKVNISFKDIGLIEINEAFAVQTIAVINELAKYYQITREELEKKVNINGGAIALGHPIGASGARILVTLVHAMKKKNIMYGIATLCIGGGMGLAILIKNTNEH